MSDPFVDNLHASLSGRSLHAQPSEDHSEAALAAWWREFVDVLGQKVGAWNERQVPKPPVNFTRQANGDVHVWHPSAEATFVRRGTDVQIATRLGAEHGREAVLTLRIAADGTIVALEDDRELRTPSAAAEHSLTPLFVQTFAMP